MSRDKCEDYYAKCANNSLEFLVDSKFVGKEKIKVKEEAYNCFCDNYLNFQAEGVSKRISMQRAYEVAIYYVEKEYYKISKDEAREDLEERGAVKVNGKNKNLYGDIWETWWDKDIPED